MEERKVNGRSGSGKGIINIIELIIVLITLFVSFNIFFPGTTYSNRWEDAYSLTKARDIVLTLDRTGKLHDYAFDDQRLQQFLSTIFPFSDTIFFSSVSGGIKGNITVACNCSWQVMSMLQGWANGMVLNNRDVNLRFCRSTLSDTDSCTEGSDVILIWGYKPLSDNYAELSKYALRGGGIVEVMDFATDGSGPSQVDGDPVQKDLFGLTYAGTSNYLMTYDRFAHVPRNVTDYLFEPYKFLYHVPITFYTGAVGPKAIPGCSYDPANGGHVTFKGDSYAYWICNSTDVWFDTDHNGIEDTMVDVAPKANFSMGRYNFSLNYVLSRSSIALSLKPSYSFDDFLSTQSGNAQADIQPADGNNERVIMKAYDGAADYLPAAIANRLGGGNLLWLPDLSKGGYGDDERALLLSSLLWTSSKESVGPIASDVRTAYIASYINTENRDMFEIYKFNFGVGYPF